MKERGGVEAYEGRPIKPVDNGNVSGKHLARNFANTPQPLRASSPSPLVGEGGVGGREANTSPRTGALRPSSSRAKPPDPHP